MRSANARATVATPRLTANARQLGRFSAKAAVDDDLVQGTLENGKLLIIELRDEHSTPPRAWTAALSVSRATPASVSATTTPRLRRDASFEVVFRHFPLRSSHPHAQAAAAAAEAAEAAEAAARQGRFWEMHDLLFRYQRRLEPAELHKYAELLGLDLRRFESDLADPAVELRVERDVESGEDSEVDGTPSLFIDGSRYEGPRDAASLERTLSPG